MAIVVGENSYVTELELTNYASARDITITGNTETLLIKAMDYIEIQSYWGEKTDEEQDLEFPRNGDTSVPAKIKTAQIVAALLIDSGETLFQTGEQAVKRESVGSVEIEYQDNTSSIKTFPQLNALLSPFTNNTGMSFGVYRG